MDAIPTAARSSMKNIKPWGPSIFVLMVQKSVISCKGSCPWNHGSCPWKAVVFSRKSYGPSPKSVPRLERAPLGGLQCYNNSYLEDTWKRGLGLGIYEYLGYVLYMYIYMTYYEIIHDPIWVGYIWNIMKHIWYMIHDNPSKINLSWYSGIWSYDIVS